MENLDLTPDLHLLSAQHEVVLPSPVSAESTNQPIGGFMASPGSLTSGNVTLDGANEKILVGQATAPGAGAGVFIGNAGDGTYDFRAGDPSGNYIWWDASSNTLTVKGEISATALDIPDTTTAHSFHVDSVGDTWWGANVSSGYSAAQAYVLNTGEARFKNITMGGGTIQYKIQDAGIFTFGDGSDGAAVMDGVNTFSFATLAGSNYTLTRDVYLTDFTLNSSIGLIPAGYRIFCRGTATINGTISRIGPNGSAGGDAPGGTLSSVGGNGGAAIPDGYLKGSVAGAAGAGTVYNNPGTNGTNGTATTNSLGSNGQNSGKGGNASGIGSKIIGGAAGVGGTATASNVKLIANWHLQTLLDISSSGATVKFNNSAGAAGGGSGGSYNPNGEAGGGGGGGGTAGGIIAIYAVTLIIGATGHIYATGGNGGPGGAGINVAGTDGTGGGGGGAGGNGGIIILVFNTYTNNGTVSVAGGSGGPGGPSGGGGSTAGSAGADGLTGTIYEFQTSI